MLNSPRIRSVTAVLYRGDQALEREELLAVEDPLEIRVRLAGDPAEVPLSMTMRTPGDDAELAAGFLYTEGVVQRSEQIAGIVVERSLVRVDLPATTPSSWSAGAPASSWSRRSSWPRSPSSLLSVRRPASPSSSRKKPA